MHMYVQRVQYVQLYRICSIRVVGALGAIRAIDVRNRFVLFFAQFLRRKVDINFDLNLNPPPLPLYSYCHLIPIYFPFFIVKKLIVTSTIIRKHRIASPIRKLLLLL